ASEGGRDLGEYIQQVRPEQPIRRVQGKQHGPRRRLAWVDAVCGAGKTMNVRVPVLKTYKMFIGGQFPRCESGRSYVLNDPKGRPLANVCQGSRKDFREAVVKARAAVKDWSGRSGYNRGQILYRLAELVE